MKLQARSFRWRAATAAALAILLAAAPVTAQTSSADVIRGRVASADSTPLDGVTVTATAITSRVSKTAKTNKAGVFTIVFPDGDGDYLVSFAHIGFDPLVGRQVKRLADEDVLVINAVLTKSAVRLDAMRVNADRQRAPREAGMQGPETGGSFTGFMTTGNLSAMLASLPGVTVVPSADGGPPTISVLGLPAEQNLVTLNGMIISSTAFGAGAPMARLSTTSYDPARGGFSGGLISLVTGRGSNNEQRTLSLRLDDPGLQWSDRASRALGTQSRDLRSFGRLSGPIVLDKSFFTLSYQASRQTSDERSLLGADDAALQRLGIAPDSASRLNGILQSAGVPLMLPGLATTRQVTNGSFIGTFDASPSGATAWGALAMLNYGRSQPVSALPSAYPTHAGEQTSVTAALQTRQSKYFNSGVLIETTVGVNVSAVDADPYLALPDGRVRVNSQLADGAAGVSNLSFGGNAALAQRTRELRAQIVNQLSWLSMNNKHRLKLTSEARAERVADERRTNQFGTYWYNSVADVETGAPSMFTRRLDPRQQAVSHLATSLAFGDSYRPRSNVQLQFGARMDASHYLTQPVANPALSELGLRNDRVPNSVFLSPRFGFSWTVGRQTQASGFSGAMHDPRAVIRGGIGTFRLSPSARLLAGALDETGLPSGARTINCVGQAVPRPDWSAYRDDASTIPDRCADGGTGAAFASNQPNVTMFAGGYAPQTSLRSNLSWSGNVLDNRFRLVVEGLYSRNFNQPGFRDANLRRGAQFALGREGGRPVFADPTSIVASTGAIALRASRAVNAFGVVSEQRSDLVSDSRVLSIEVSPYTAGHSSTFWSVRYTRSSMSDLTRGFGGTTSGDPFSREWARSSADARHQLTYSASYSGRESFSVGFNGRTASGTPFTPMVASDINGDGYANDRAFISESTLESLRGDATDAARSCLARQVGRIAARASCEGPWATSLNLFVNVHAGSFRLPSRLGLNVQLANPLTAVDRVLHGADAMRGWGQVAQPDASLLYVRSFDAATRSFAYDVNRRFGEARSTRAGEFNPAKLTITFNWMASPEPERQVLREQLGRGRDRSGAKLTEAQLKSAYARGGFPNPLDGLLRNADSLGLSGTQADSIAALNKRYLERLDATWAPVIKYFASLPATYDAAEAYEQFRRARLETIDALMSVAPVAKRLLTPAQTRQLPPAILQYLEQSLLEHLRSDVRRGMTHG